MCGLTEKQVKAVKNLPEDLLSPDMLMSFFTAQAA